MDNCHGAWNKKKTKRSASNCKCALHVPHLQHFNTSIRVVVSFFVPVRKPRHSLQQIRHNERRFCMNFIDSTSRVALACLGTSRQALTQNLISV